MANTSFVYKVGRFTSRTHFVNGILNDFVKILDYDRRRVSLSVVFHFGSSPSEIIFALGGRVDAAYSVRKITDVPLFATYVFRKSEIGGIVCGEVWGRAVGAAGLFFMAELLRD